MFSGDKIWPHFQWNLGEFDPKIEKKIPIFKKKIIIFFFFNIGIYTQSKHLQASLSLMAIVCVITNFFFIDQKRHICAL